MSDYFPQEVLADILLRLPTKTIGLCSCVCKSWHSAITNPTFVHNHFTQTQNDNDRRRLFLLRHFPETHNRERYSLHSDNYAFDKVQDLDFPLQSFNRHFRIVGSCNGVLCLSDDTTVITANFVLWNPSIRKYISLPRPLVSCSSHGLFTFALGFGFDSLSCDYKVVMLAYLKTKYGFYSSRRPTVNVYSLNTNSWRDVSATALSYRVVEFLWTQVFMNGAVHWIASTHDIGLKLERFNKSPFGNLILRFDLAHEVFDKMSLPESLVSSTQYELSITVLGERLSVVQFHRRSYHACSIWMMEEYGVAESWTKWLEIGLMYEIPDRRRVVTGVEVQNHDAGQPLSNVYGDKIQKQWGNTFAFLETWLMDGLVQPRIA
ncbi:F-box/kelch-repeat protein [Tripterygium wilfordii]|uniref:F-box/kelch-repeat protein n=1 Tax=Tripterygium wilfordii TaxID=458696 RepID=A0A7J7D100_TRIWF|nr:F-box/kelch-repeat protein [Tripterygium wilfordii]